MSDPSNCPVCGEPMHWFCCRVEWLCVTPDCRYRSMTMKQKSEENLAPPDDVMEELTTRAYIPHRENLNEAQNIFQAFDFILPNGDPSIFKIECDHLAAEDIECFAKMVGHVSFKSVEGIPRGGVPFAEALEKYIDPESEVHLVVDDVLASGKSMTDAMQAAFDRGEEVVRGIVIFSRGPKINNCVPIFQMHPFWSEL